MVRGYNRWLIIIINTLTTGDGAGCRKLLQNQNYPCFSGLSGLVNVTVGTLGCNSLAGWGHALIFLVAPLAFLTNDIYTHETNVIGSRLEVGLSCDRYFTLA